MSYYVNKLAGLMASRRRSQDKMIEFVLEEMANGEINEVAMAKARMDALGVDERIQPLYIKNRIQQIKDELQILKMNVQELQRVETEKMYAARRQARVLENLKEYAEDKMEEDVSSADTVKGVIIVLLVLVVIVGAAAF